MHSPRNRRLAFTLVELLVVIAIILVITTLGALAIPSQQDRVMQQGADQLQGWLLIAKQRAKREGLPTGVRILFDASGNATQCAYVQQPEDYDAYGSTCKCTGTTSVTFANGINPQGGTATVDLNAAGVQAGDYLEFNRGGGVFQITAVGATAVTLATSGPNLFGTSNSAGTTTEFRIRRQPILLVGEETLNLPDGTALDLAKSKNIPQRTVAGTTFNEIVFSPQGGLVGRGSGSDQIVIPWLKNTNNTNLPALLLAIQAHTGFIAVQQENTDLSRGDAYLLCRDARASRLNEERTRS